jgi:succinate-acetate transporter protein
MFEINFVNHDILLKIKTGYIKTDEGGVNTQYKSNKKQKMGTYVVNIYGWLIWKLTVPQRTLESKTNMQYIFKIICILQSLNTGRKILKG